MAKRNYSYEKRQKELKKQKKREEKRQKKLDKNKPALEEVPADAPPEEESS